MINNLVSFNKLAMENLSQNKVEMAYHFMHRAEKILNSLAESFDKDSLTLITCNNQACLYKAMGQSYQSLKFLYRAIKISPNTPEDFFNLARCYLNLSLLKSEENDTEAALNHSMKALDLLSNHCEDDVDNYYENLCTAFNIIANQHRIQGNSDESFRVYKRGYEISSKFLGSTHPLTQDFFSKLEHRRLRFIKKPKTSGINLPKMLNRAWPQTNSSNKQKIDSRRGTSLDFSADSRLKTKRIFTKEVSINSTKNHVNTSEIVMRKTQATFLNNSPKIKTLKINTLDVAKHVNIIQNVFRTFLAKEKFEEFRDSKLTRRQLAEKKAILALQEFEILKGLAEKENPYYDHNEARISTKTQSRRSSKRNA